jgi:hypothetical protein
MVIPNTEKSYIRLIKQNKLKENLKNLKKLSTQIHINHPVVNKMTQQQRTKRYNNAQNTLNQLEKQIKKIKRELVRLKIKR